METKTCAACLWRDEYTDVCCNGDSPMRGDVTDDTACCEEWSGRWPNNGG